MKKYFYIVVGVVVCAALLLVGYGAFLNYTSEKNIAQMLSGRRINVEGKIAKREVIRGQYTDNNMRLEAENFADVVTLNSGMLEEVYVEQGSKVKKGQALAKVVSEEVAMKIAEIDAELAKAQTSLDRYQASYERYGRLIDKGAVSLEQYDDVKANYLGAKSQVKAYQLQKQQYVLQQERLTIKAPLDGTVVMLYKKQGSYLAAGSPVALVGDFSTLIYKEELADNRMAALQPLEQNWTLKFDKTDLQRLYINTYKANNKGYEEGFLARVIRIDPPLTVAAQMRTVYWRIDNSSNMLEPKHYQNVHFVAGDVHEGIVIPKAALKNNNTVFVWGKNKKLEERPVVLGVYTLDGVEVLKGVQEGETVIISETNGLTASSRVDVVVKEGM